MAASVGTGAIVQPLIQVLSRDQHIVNEHGVFGRKEQIAPGTERSRRTGRDPHRPDGERFRMMPAIHTAMSKPDGRNALMVVGHEPGRRYKDLLRQLHLRP